VPVNGPTANIDGVKPPHEGAALHHRELALEPGEGLGRDVGQPATHFTLTDTVAVEPPLSV